VSLRATVLLQLGETEMANKPSNNPYAFQGTLPKNSKEIMVSYLNKEMDIYRSLKPEDLDENYVEGILTAYGRVLNFVNPSRDNDYFELLV
jgi:hypothetical protein